MRVSGCRECLMFLSEAGLERSVVAQGGGTLAEEPGEGAAGDGKQVSRYLLEE